jgi:hypothetical protein
MWAEIFSVPNIGSSLSFSSSSSSSSSFAYVPTAESGDKSGFELHPRIDYYFILFGLRIKERLRILKL